LLLSDPEVRAQVLHVHSQSVGDSLERFGRCSDWNFLTRIVARIRRTGHSKPQLVCLAVEEIEQAELSIIVLAQQVFFGDDWHWREPGGWEIATTTRTSCCNEVTARPEIKEPLLERIRISHFCGSSHGSTTLENHRKLEICHEDRKGTVSLPQDNRSLL